MTAWDIQCPMCGQQYASEEHQGCKSCPIQNNCTLVCCPACGYQTVNVRKSRFARFVQMLLPNKPRRNPTGRGTIGTSLAEVPAGSRAQVLAFSEDFPADRRAYLQAYGLVPNYWVQVVQHSPVTIVRLDHLELALENDLARGIEVHQHSITQEVESSG